MWSGGKPECFWKTLRTCEKGSYLPVCFCSQCFIITVGMASSKEELNLKDSCYIIEHVSAGRGQYGGSSADTHITFSKQGNKGRGGWAILVLFVTLCCNPKLHQLVAGLRDFWGGMKGNLETNKWTKQVRCFDQNLDSPVFTGFLKTQLRVKLLVVELKLIPFSLDNLDLPHLITVYISHCGNFTLNTENSAVNPRVAW